jgi:tRNA (cytidine/uridine-2'-O-)-methyltransferase
MFNLILFEPEIPPNTGNIIRLCANTGVSLHLVKPLGFPLEDKKLRRAGLDYHEYAEMKVHDSWEDCLSAMAGKRLFAVSTRGTTRYDTVQYQAGDCFVLGPETRGLPKTLLESFVTERRLRLPMRANSRSLNLANSAAVLVYEAWRQHGFSGGT